MAKYDIELGHRYGKPDIERIGLFAEMSYMNGKGYVSPFASKYFNMNYNLLLFC